MRLTTTVKLHLPWNFCCCYNRQTIPHLSCYPTQTPHNVTRLYFNNFEIVIYSTKIHFIRFFSTNVNPNENFIFSKSTSKIGNDKIIDDFPAVHPKLNQKVHGQLFKLIARRCCHFVSTHL